MLAADLTGATATAALSAASQSDQAAYDGCFYVVWSVGATAAFRVWDVSTATMNEVMNIGVPTNSPNPGTPQTAPNEAAFFDGKAIYFLSNDSLPTVVVMPAGRYGSAYNARLGSVATHAVRGFATDGVNLWATMSDGSSCHFVRVLLV